MKIRALKTFAVYTGTQVKVFNAGKKGAKATEDELPDNIALAYIEFGHAEAVKKGAVSTAKEEPEAEGDGECAAADEADAGDPPA